MVLRLPSHGALEHLGIREPGHRHPVRSEAEEREPKIVRVPDNEESRKILKKKVQMQVLVIVLSALGLALAIVELIPPSWR